jgi:hypothetical protein
MKLKNTLLLLLLTIGLGIGYYFAEKKIPTTQEVEKKKDKIIEIKASEVMEVMIKGVDRDLLFRKKDGKWFFEKPIQVRAKLSEIEGLLSSIEFLQARRVFSPKTLQESKLTLSDYGLDKPRLVATIKSKDSSATLNIGNEFRQGDNLFVQVSADPNVYLVDKYLAVRLGKKIEEYRDPAVFDVITDNIRGFEIKSGTKLLEFARTNNIWRIVQPLSARADASKVEQFLQQTTSLLASDFLSEDPSVLKEHGLEEAQQEVTLKFDQPDSNLSLLLGNKLKNDESKMAAKVKSEKSILAIPSSYRTDAVRPLNDYRDRTLVNYVPSEVQEIELKERQISVVLHRDGEAWKIVQPEKLEADKELVERLLNKFNSIQIKDFATDVLADLDKFGLKVPASTVIFRNKVTESGATTNQSPSSTVLEIALGKGDAAKKMSYVKLANESSVYGLDSTEITDLPKGILDLRSRVIFEIKRDALKSAFQKKGKSTTTVNWNDGKWVLPEGLQGVLNDGALQKIQERLERFHVEKIIGPALNTTAKQFGLDVPVVTYYFNAEIDGKPVVQEVLVGRENAQKKYFILWKNQLLVCEVTRDFYQILTADWLTKPSAK